MTNSTRICNFYTISFKKLQVHHTLSLLCNVSQLDWQLISSHFIGTKSNLIITHQGTNSRVVLGMFACHPLSGNHGQSFQKLNQLSSYYHQLSKPNGTGLCTRISMGKEVFSNSRQSPCPSTLIPSCHLAETLQPHP